VALLHGASSRLLATEDKFLLPLFLSFWDKSVAAFISSALLPCDQWLDLFTPRENCLLQCPSGLLHALLLYFARLCSVLLLAAVFFAAKNRAILCYGQIMVRNFLLQLLVVLVSPFFLRNFNTPGFSYWWQLCRRYFIVFFHSCRNHHLMLESYIIYAG